MWGRDRRTRQTRSTDTPSSVAITPTVTSFGGRGTLRIVNTFRTGKDTIALHQSAGGHGRNAKVLSDMKLSVMTSHDALHTWWSSPPPRLSVGINGGLLFVFLHAPGPVPFAGVSACLPGLRPPALCIPQPWLPHARQHGGALPDILQS